LPGPDLPVGVDFDVVLSQSRFAHHGALAEMANQLHLPLVCLEHTQDYPDWTADMRAQLRAMRGHVNVFITDVSRKGWGFGDDPSACVIEHGIDTDLFSPDGGGRRAVALSVVNEWASRDKPCGYNWWRRATAGIPVRVVGDNPGLSEPASGPEGLAGIYASHAVFVNTSQISPVPTSLLEAMAAGCVVVSTATCQIPDVIESGKTGVLCDTPDQMRAVLGEILASPQNYGYLGENARAYVRKRYGLDRFVKEWDEVLRGAAATPFLARL
jgi:glycosyltransferase involved in cell wall biosynthesis